MNNKQMLRAQVAVNKVGWFAVQDRHGGWIGTPDGVTCYADELLARAAMTILWQRDGGGALRYRVRRFTGADAIIGEHTPKLSAGEAIRRYEGKTASW